MNDLPLWLSNLITFINQPLPIIGISGLTVGGIVIAILRTVLPSNKQITMLKAENNALQVALNTTRDYANLRITTLETRVNELESALNQVVSNTPNRRVRNLSIKEQPKLDVEKVVAVVETVDKVVKKVRKARK